MSKSCFLLGARVCVGLLLGLALMAMSGLVEARTWTSADGGKTFDAELVSFDEATGKVTVKKVNGSTMSFDQENLSESDIAFLKKQGGGAKAVPGELSDPDGQEANMSKPVQVFILMGQSNMLGFGKVAGAKDGTLEYATNEKGLYPFLVDDEGVWTTRRDVRNVRVMNSKDQKNDWLTAGNTKAIGPELGFGSVVGDVLEAPVMILKSCIGNRSLGWDLLPPGSEQYEYEGKTYAGYKDSPDSWVEGEEKKKVNWYAGKQYDDDVAGAKMVLANLDKYYPGAKGYEVAGFVFWQGDKDRYNAAHASRYEQNMVQLIKQLRMEFDAPDAKFVCATLGQTAKGAKGNEGLILDAQMAVDGESGKYDEFKGNVATVYSHPLSKGGASNGHYEGNAETYMNVGLALGRAMSELLRE